MPINPIVSSTLPALKFGPEDNVIFFLYDSPSLIIVIGISWLGFFSTMLTAAVQLATSILLIEIIR
mgnify:CR=1 FL=1